MGIVVGAGVGVFPGYRVICLIEGNAAHFIHDPQPFAVFPAVPTTAGFSVVLNMIALRKVKNQKLTDI